MKNLITLMVLALLVSPAPAHSRTTKNLEAVTQKMAKALVSQDYISAAELVYQPIIDAFGGKEATAEGTREVFDKMNNIGYRLTEMTFLKPEQPAIVGRQLHAVVPYIGVLRNQKGKLQFRSYYYAISDNDGQSWTLADGGKLNSETIKVIFPAYQGIPKLPTKEKPVFIPDLDPESN
jgi:hypothetical protein